MVTLDGQPWFVATDINDALGWSYQNLRYHVGASLGSEEFQSLSKRDASQAGMSSLFGDRQAWLPLISESGLYKLVMRSDKPEAKAFQDWVTKEVLPAIRKDGGYIMGEEKVRTGEMSLAFHSGPGITRSKTLTSR